VDYLGKIINILLAGVNVKDFLHPDVRPAVVLTLVRLSPSTIKIQQ